MDKETISNLTKAYRLQVSLRIYIERLEDRGTVKVAYKLFTDYINSIGQVNNLVRSTEQVSVTCDMDALEALRVETNTKLQLDWLFVLQETAQRFLSCVDKNNLRHSLKRKFNLCMESGEQINNFIRKHARAIGTEYEENLDEMSDKIYEMLDDLN